MDVDVRVQLHALKVIMQNIMQNIYWEDKQFETDVREIKKKDDKGI